MLCSSSIKQRITSDSLGNFHSFFVRNLKWQLKNKSLDWWNVKLLISFCNSYSIVSTFTGNNGVILQSAISILILCILLTYSISSVAYHHDDRIQVRQTLPLFVIIDDFNQSTSDEISTRFNFLKIPRHQDRPTFATPDLSHIININFSLKFYSIHWLLQNMSRFWAFLL